MKYYSLNHNAPKVSFEEAVIQGLATDKGLYFPESITALAPEFFENIENLSNAEIAFEAIKQFVGDEIPTETLKQIINETLCFEFPTVKVEDGWELVLCLVVLDISIKTKKTTKIRFL
jgi:threonine synthase